MLSRGASCVHARLRSPTAAPPNLLLLCPPRLCPPAVQLVDRTSPVDERVRRLFEWSFLAYGRVSNLSHVLAYHPSYLQCFLNTLQVLLYEEGACLCASARRAAAGQRGG